MVCNVGGVDRMGRFIVGAVLLIIGFLAPLTTGWQIVVFVVAAIALITAIVRYCPANAILGINTCRREERAGRNT